MKNLPEHRRVRSAKAASFLRKAVVPTRKQMEADLAQALLQFQKECLGRGAEETKTALSADQVFFRCRKVLLPRELRLLKRQPTTVNRLMVKNMRRELIEQNRDVLESLVSAVVGVPIRSLYYDLSTSADECVFVLVFAQPILFDPE